MYTQTHQDAAPPLLALPTTSPDSRTRGEHVYIYMYIGAPHLILGELYCLQRSSLSLVSRFWGPAAVKGNQIRGADPSEGWAAEMAEIALLVAEEYERMKRWHKGEVDGLNCALSSYFSSLGKKEQAEGAFPSPFQKEGKMVVVVGLRKALEPRSPLGLAAMEGFFPA